jgi:hypothetical protein
MAKSVKILKCIILESSRELANGILQRFKFWKNIFLTIPQSSKSQKKNIDQ